jgi:hypothetical protein
MRGIVTIHYVDFHSDARHAVCGWVPPEDYAGTSVYMTAASCPACRQAIQQRISDLASRVERRPATASTTAP